MRYYDKKTNRICFDNFDLKRLFEAAKKPKLLEEIIKSGYSLEDLKKDDKKRQDIVDKTRIIDDKEDIEIFSALYVFSKFYPRSKLCFLLKSGVDHREIDTLKKLKNGLQESNLTDFGLMTEDELRAFQLKQYRGRTETNELFNFIKEKLLHYGNDLGDVNLLVVLQSGGDIQGPFFQDLHEHLKALNIKGGGHILISYNEENKFDVINTVYPILGTTRIPHESLV